MGMGYGGVWVVRATVKLLLGDKKAPHGGALFALGKGFHLTDSQHQVVETMHEARRIFQLPTFGKDGLIQQDA